MRKLLAQITMIFVLGIQTTSAGEFRLGIATPRGTTPAEPDVSSGFKFNGHGALGFGLAVPRKATPRTQPDAPSGYRLDGPGLDGTIIARSNGAGGYRLDGPGLGGTIIARPNGVGGYRLDGPGLGGTIIARPNGGGYIVDGLDEIIRARPF